MLIDGTIELDIFGNKSGTLQHRLSSKSDTLLFLTIFVIGFFVIFIFNIVIDRPDKLKVGEISARILIPCILLAVYACMVWLIRKFKLTSEQAGDNCYYLGFIFTLVSLAFALYDFVVGGDRILIVQDFGIALSTTIVGLLLRVLFSQSRLDPEHVEFAAREALAKSARELRNELHRVVIDFNSFRRYYQQSLNDSLRENKKLIGEFQSQYSEHQQQTTEQWSRNITKTLENFADHTQQLSDAIEKSTTAFGSLAESMESKSQNLGAARNEFDQIKLSLESINDQLTKLSDVLNEELIDVLIKFKLRILVVQSTIDGNEETLKESVAVIGKFANDVKQLEPTLENLSESPLIRDFKPRKSIFNLIRFWSKSD